MNETFGWAICLPQHWSANGGEPLLYTIARVRSDSIDKALALWGPNFTWKKLYRQGWRARHVRVTAILFGKDA